MLLKMSCNFKGNEPSPKGLGKCAHLQIEGMIMKGKDGKKWIVKRRSNNSLYWSKYDASPANLSPIAKRRKRRIIIAEPRTYSKANKFVQQKPIVVTEEFYRILNKMPKNYQGKNTNAYVFGKKFKLSEYQKIRWHGNDAAQTGLIDYDKWNDNTISTLRKQLDSIDKKYNYQYDSPENVKEVRTLTNGAILFQGETVGGDVGADLFAHYGRDGDINSLIIDNSHFFKPPPED